MERLVWQCERVDRQSFIPELLVEPVALVAGVGVGEEEDAKLPSI